MVPPSALILRAPGTNCDEETAFAWAKVGARIEVCHISRVLSEPRYLDRFQILTIPGGFSYGDDLGAGRIFAVRLRTLGDALTRFRERSGLILGICNGFQVLVQSGLLPGTGRGRATLTHNDSGRFEARWARLGPISGRCAFLDGDQPIELPVAHGEGKFLTSTPSELTALESAGQVVLRYLDSRGRATQAFPENPNGSPGAVAGLCDASGRVFGLMPHPERYIDAFQHPRWTREKRRPEGDGLRFFRNAIQYIRT